MIKILTDSTCDIDRKTAQELGLNIIPLNVYFGEESYKDGVNMTSAEFYNKLTGSSIHPKTSQPTPDDFKKIYSELMQDGSEIISIHISSKMSGTIQSAHMARNELDSGKIHIIDSGCVSIALAFMAIECAEAAAKGVSIDKITEIVNRLKKEMQIYFVVDTLEYLHKGGRIGRAAALIGGLLNIKPILTITDGIVSPAEKVRGTKKAIKRMGELFSNYIKSNGSSIKTGFAYSCDPEYFKDIIKTITGCNDTSQYPALGIGPVVGTHAGPGTIAICFYPAGN